MCGSAFIEQERGGAWVLQWGWGCMCVCLLDWKSSQESMGSIDTDGPHRLTYRPGQSGRAGKALVPIQQATPEKQVKSDRT